MNTKTILISLFTAFIVIATLGVASAVSLSDFTITALSGVAHNAGSAQFSFTLTNDGAAGNVIISSTSLSGISSISFSSTNVSMADGSVTPTTATVIGTAYFTANQAGPLSAVIIATPPAPANAKNATLTINLAVSNSVSVSSIQSLTKTQNGIINITNNGNTALTSLNLTASGDFDVSLSSTSLSLAAGGSSTVTVTSLTNLSALDVGRYTTTITVRDLTTSVTGSQSYTVTSDFCENQNVNTSSIEITDLDDVSSDTEDEWEWKPLDNVELEVDVKNNLDDDEDFVVELGLYDTNEHEFVEIDGEDALEQEISLDEDDSETLTFEFEVPVELEDSEGRYVVYVKAYVDGDEDVVCNSYAGDDIPDSSFESLEIVKDDNDVIINSDEITSPELVTAGETVRISAKVYNIGTENEDKVKVTLSNSKLGLSLESTSFELDSEDAETVDFAFVVPQNVEDGTYTLRMITYFDYSKSSDTYKQDSEDVWDVSIRIVGGTNTTRSVSSSSSISASLDNKGAVNSGDVLNVTVTIKNLNANKTTFTINAKNYESWAALSSISDRIITLDSGASKDIKLSFKVNEGVSAGEQTFTVETVAGSKIDSKVVAVNIGSGSLLSSLANSIGASKTALAWVLGAVCLVLLVAIIFIWLRISRR